MRGKISKPYFNTFSNRWAVELQFDRPPETIEKYVDKDLDIELKIHREKRSLNANAYFHLLVEKIAGVQKVTHTEIHNQLIADYGYIDEDINNVILDDAIDWRRIETLHLKPTTATRVMDNGRLYRVYYVMRGSHTYNTAEMSRLIDGTVAEAKELDIETLSPEQLQRMKQQWEGFREHYRKQGVI